MGIISRQVWEIAHFIMKVVSTRLLAVPDMVPHCHLVIAQGFCFCSFSHFGILSFQKPVKNVEMQLCDSKSGKKRDEENLTSSQMSDQTETSTFLNPIT